MANPNLQKIIKLTQDQYNTLSNGGTVGGYTGLNDNYLYLIQDPLEKLPLIEIPRNGDIMLSELPTGSFALSGMLNDTWICTITPILLISHASGLRLTAYNTTDYCTGICRVSDAENLSIKSILGGGESGFTVTPYSAPGATTIQAGVVEIMTDEEMDAQTGGTSPTSTVNPIVDLVYPIGSVYMSRSSSVNPNLLFAGTTWVSLGTAYIPNNTNQSITSTGAYLYFTKSGSATGTVVYSAANTLAVSGSSGSDLKLASGVQQSMQTTLNNYFIVYMYERTA